MGSARRAGVVAVLALAVAAGPLAAQECRGIRGGRAAVVVGAFAAGEATAMAVRSESWFEGPPRSLRISWDRSPSAEQDGLEHAAVSYQLSQVAALAWDWTCASPKAAGWLGAATAFAAGLPKEFFDGIHKNGASWRDLTWAAAGAALPAIHRQWPRTRTVMLKVWYWPSDEYRNRASNGGTPQLDGDYSGQRYFLSINPARGYDGAAAWPDWLGIGIGHSTPAWVAQPAPGHEWYVALDVDLRSLPVRAAWWRTVATLLDQIHFPSPGVRFSEGSAKLGFF